MTQPASSPFLSKSRTRIIPYSNMVTGSTVQAIGDTTVIYVGDCQTLLGERSVVPAAGKPNTAAQLRQSIGTRLVIYAWSESGHEIRVNYANNDVTTPAGWMQVAIYPLILAYPINVELTVTAPYIRIDLGCWLVGRAHWAISVRGPQ